MGVSITINIDDESRFKEVITNEIDALKPEEIKGIVIDAIKEMLHANNNEILRKILVTESYNRYDSGKNYEATKLLMNILDSFDYSAGQELANDILNELKTNHKAITEKVMINMFLAGLTDQYKFRENMREVLYDINNRDNR